ncbi:DUF6387 family protein [Nitrosomonas oligotropha]|uniref:Uncharacterized protein n=1 Tax=Nitrosomonas oligotropha TaxID=42354 RepID=A0A1H8UL78_9PROT|nr:DUF6387 family protein [Nitrosomonas oligotropha]SDW16239.1 hypothetical protein SAMN05216300_10210 [Nitrosomonas oligotropha]SEP03767.1 hypothetical protein SAMN05216333_13710 [Nitrosomonas oligotropha]
METWKKIPSWFKLDNYRDSFNFTAKEWLEEISKRQNKAVIFMSPDYYSEILLMSPDDFSEEMEAAIQFFDNIKKQPLISCRYDVRYSELEEILGDFKITENEYKHKFATVQELSEYNAYMFFFNSDKRIEIENDLSSLYSVHVDREDWVNGIKRNFDIKRKYSQPIANHDMFEGSKFLEIYLNSSDEQILYEFKKWLVDTRNSSDKFIKRQLSTKDFQDWSESQLLPYWDLTTIAAIENATIPYHVLGNALFPDEYGVDLTERIRKITKKKCQYMFSGEVFGALLAQARSEELSRNNLL